MEELTIATDRLRLVLVGNDGDENVPTEMVDDGLAIADGIPATEQVEICKYTMPFILGRGALKVPYVCFPKWC